VRVALALVVLAAGCASVGPSREPPQQPLYDGEPLSFWVRQLHDLNPERSRSAVHAVAAFGKAALPLRDPLIV